jgi:predicted dinucleotide-binding enzyme
MNITIIGRGNVGGGLAKLWEGAGHTVQALGRDGGDASAADVVVVAVPGQSVADALAKVTGIAGKPAIDATNARGGRNEAFASIAAEVKSIVGGPVAKSFNLNFAVLYDQIAAQEKRPSSPYAADEEIAELTQQLIRDAGYEPVSAGNLDGARALEDGLALLFGIVQAGKGPFFYRIGSPGEL